MRRMTEQEQLLVEKNYGLIFSFLNSHELEESDYYDTVAIALCHAAMTYSENEEQGAFGHYAYLCMDQAVCREHEKKQFYVEIPQENLVFYSCVPENVRRENFINFSYIEESALFRHNFSLFIKQLDQKTKKVVQMFVYGYKQAKIADALGCTQSYVSKIRKKLVYQWKRYSGSMVRPYQQSF